MNILASALDYARRSWAVFPCKPCTQKPATRRGFKDASTETARIDRWWPNGSKRNLAIATGQVSGLIVIDVDPRHGGDTTLADLIAEHGPLPATPTAKTGGGGLHFLFKHPGGQIKSRNNALGPGIDVKADGGYIVAPPSIHPNGNVYEWQQSPEHVKVCEAPAWVVELLTQKGNEGGGNCCISAPLDVCASAPLRVCASVPLCHTVKEAIDLTLPSAPGQRNLAIFKFARALRSMPTTADADPETLRGHVRDWHDAANTVTSGEHDFDDTWADFCYGWPRVKYLLGDGFLVEALKQADAMETPACAEQYEGIGRRLVRLCKLLQANAGDKPFFLDQRAAASAFGVGRNKPGRLLAMLCFDDVIELVRKGHTGRASEYRYKGD